MGAGHLNGNTEFVKEFNEFYFCLEPEKLFSSHYPEEQKWQLIYPFLTLDEFSKRVKFSDKFNDFFTTDLKYHTIKVKNKHTIRFNKINEKANIEGIVSVYDKNGNNSNNILSVILYNKNYIDYFYIFKKKGIYKTELYAALKTKKLKDHMVTFYLECEEDWKTSENNPFSLPETYNNDITIVEPILNIMKKGKKVTLKFRSDVTDEIIITNGEWLKIKKNKDGIFETTLTVKAEEIHIGRKTKKSECSISIIYKVNKK